MIAGIISDVHLEFGRGDLNIPDCDLLILAGDIMCLNSSGQNHNKMRKLIKRYKKFLYDCEKAAKNTIIVLGNHEYYGGMFGDVVSQFKDFISEFKTIKLLDNNSTQINNVMIYGCTLWTDMKAGDQSVMDDIKRGMYDFTGIFRDASCPITPELILRENRYQKKRLQDFLGKDYGDLKTIVVSHHAPIWECVALKYRHDVLSYGFANTDLDDMIYDGDGPDLWVHGHMHQQIDFMYGNKTRIICNARGCLNIEKNVNEVQVKLIEI